MPTLASANIGATVELLPAVVDFVSRPRQMYLDGQWVDAVNIAL